jgi:hypothetical protein
MDRTSSENHILDFSRDQNETVATCQNGFGVGHSAKPEMPWSMKLNRQFAEFERALGVGLEETEGHESES